MRPSITITERTVNQIANVRSQNQINLNYLLFHLDRDASLNSWAALAISKTLPAISSNDILVGPIPRVHSLTSPDISVPSGAHPSKILASPSIPSAFHLNIPARSPSNILDTPFITSPNSLLIPPIISLNSAPTN